MAGSMSAGNPMGNIAKRIKSVASDITTVRTATVVSDNAPLDQTLVTLDNDPAQTPINAVGLSFPLPKGTRVSCLAFPPRGLLVLGTTVDQAYTYVPPVDTGWTVVGSGGGAPAFQNSWVNYDASIYEPARFRKIGNQVFVEGLIANGTASIAFTLPVGYRPLRQKLRAGLVYQVLTGVNVNTGNNFTDGANIVNTSNPVAGSGVVNHVHPHAHQHQVNLVITNNGHRFDIYPTGEVAVTAAHSYLYASLGFSFFID